MLMFAVCESTSSVHLRMAPFPLTTYSTNRKNKKQGSLNSLENIELKTIQDKNCSPLLS